MTAKGLVVIPRDGCSAVRFFDSAVSLAACCQGRHVRFSRARHLPTRPTQGSIVDSIDTATLGLSELTISSGYDDETDTLVLSDCDQLVGVRVATRTVLWRHGDMGNCCSVAVLGPQVRRQVLCCQPRPTVVFAFRLQAVVVAGSNSYGDVRVYGLDGTELARAPATGALYVAADPLHSSVYASTRTGTKAWTWDGKDLVALDSTSLESEGSTSVALTVMPPAPGRRLSHLITAVRSSSRIQESG